MKEGDVFRYGPWGGNCKATFVGGILRFYRISRGVKTVIMSWKCRSPQDTQTLLSGGTVNVIWDGKGSKPMKVKDGNTFAVTHGTTVYYFIREGVSMNTSDDLPYHGQLIIVLTSTDFHYSTIQQCSRIQQSNQNQ